MSVFKYKKSVRFCINESGIVYKIFSIYLAKDGSFMVDLPYCNYDECLVFKSPVTYSNKVEYTYIPINSIIQKLKASQKPKLTIHQSGLVHFSGVGVTSGIDKKTGTIKGIGLYSAPLITPISSGPTFGVVVWGLTNGYNKAAKINSNDIVYSDKDFTVRKFPEEQKEELYAYGFDGMVFRSDCYYGKLIKQLPQGGEEITLRFPNYLHSPGATFTMKVIRLKKIPVCIGILPYKIRYYTEKEKFGFTFGGPTEKSKTLKDTYEVINACYPNFLDEDVQSLDFIT